MAEAKLTVEAQIDSVIKALQAIQAEQKKTSEGFKEAGKQASENLAKQSKATETNLEKMRSFGSRVLNQLMQDFKALGAVNSLVAGWSLNQQFTGTVRQSAELTNMIAKLGARFGVTGKEFDDFKAKMTRGLGEIGVGSDAAARALEGLAQTNVTAGDAAIEYAKQASMLASIGRDQGQEGTVATGLGRIVQEAGFQPNDVQKLKELATEVSKLVQASGMTTTQALGAIQANYESMTPEQRKRTGFGAAAQTALVQRVTPEGADFLRNYMAMPEQQRLAMDAQIKGVTGRSLLNKQGQLDTDTLRKLSGEFGRRGLDAISGATTITGDETMARGLIKLTERADDVDRGLESLSKTIEDNEKAYRKMMGIQEAFGANINQVKSGLAGFLDKMGLPSPMEATRGLLSASSEDFLTSSLAVGGAAAAAAVLTGGGLRGLGGVMGMGKREIKERMVEAATGEQVQKVTVINPEDIGEAVNNASGLSGITGMLGKFGALATVGLPVLAGAAGLAGGAYLGNAMNENIKEGSMTDRGLNAIADAIAGLIDSNRTAFNGAGRTEEFRLTVNDPRIKVEGRTNRGMAQ